MVSFIFIYPLIRLGSLVTSRPPPRLMLNSLRVCLSNKIASDGHPLLPIRINDKFKQSQKFIFNFYFWCFSVFQRNIIILHNNLQNVNPPKQRHYFNNRNLAANSTLIIVRIDKEKEILFSYPAKGRGLLLLLTQYGMLRITIHQSWKRTIEGEMGIYGKWLACIVVICYAHWMGCIRVRHSCTWLTLLISRNNCGSLRFTYSFNDEIAQAFIQHIAPNNVHLLHSKFSS